MDVATVLTLVQTILQLLDSPISREIQSLWGYRSQLQKLRNTMSTIQAVFANVERLERQQLPISIPQDMLERLQEVVYQADDLFDEITTISNLKKMMPGNKLSKEVCLFFSRFNQLHYAITKSGEIRNIRETLDDIAKDQHMFDVLAQQANVEASNINSSRETHSFVCKEDLIIGRDKDKEIVIDRLLYAAVEENVSVISIVGIGGLGKTALAKLVYNDPRIMTEFSPKMWVCVSDDFDVKSLLGKILAAATNTTNNSGLSKDQLQIKLRQELDGKRYLLVLDDAWNEDDVNKWNELINILIQGGRGSRIIVTTRSTRVANVAGSHLTHELQGLSDDDSWKLFQKVTSMESHLVGIGKEIVRKCFNVPLAIRFMGSLLKGENERTWQSLNDADLAHIKQDGGNDGIIPVLKISYHHLPQDLKSCFSYCAVYPKDYEILKEDLIYQWMAQGFIKPSDKGLSLEDEGEDYFMKLLQRCFFQDVEQDESSGVIFSCKMHDLVHDLAKEVAGIGIMLSDNNNCSLGDDKTRHVFIDKTLLGSQDVECYVTKMKNLRTFLAPRYSSSYLQFLFKMRNLRVLDLSNEYDGGSMKTLPGRMGELLHLRYLDLSWNEELIVLPDSITQLYNLQTLKLKSCSSLKELPRDLSKLVNLRHLDIDECFGLRHMPSGMNRMTCLRKLTMFVAGVVKNSTWSLGQGDIGKLEDLKELNSLRDGILITVEDGWTCDGEVKEGGYLINKPFLNEIRIWWNGEQSHNEDAEALLQGLQPHPNIKRLELSRYPEVRFPRWGHLSMNLNMNTPLPNLVELRIFDCARLERLPLLSQLRHLKVLVLKYLSKVEYVESRNFRRRDKLVFFPSLEDLTLWYLPALKGSLIVPEEVINTSSSSSDDKSNMGGGRERKQEEDNDAWRCLAPALRSLSLDHLPKMVKLPKGMQHLTALLSLHITDCENWEEIPAWIGCLSSLQHLEIWGCQRVKSLPEEMRHLTYLTHLFLFELPKMVKLPMGMQHLTSLRSLCISNCHNFEEISAWVGCLSSLQLLQVNECPRVKSLPEEMRYLTRLTHLSLYNCSPELKERCKGPTGADWPNVQHIPSILIC